MDQKRIIILEDEIIVALDIKEILEELGYACQVFHDFHLALQALDTFNPQLAICDINIGEGPSGIDFVKQALQLKPQLAIIYLTAFSDRKIVELAGKTHPVNYILKPWSDHQIRVSVEMAFDQILSVAQQSQNIGCALNNIATRAVNALNAGFTQIIIILRRNNTAGDNLDVATPGFTQTSHKFGD